MNSIYFLTFLTHLISSLTIDYLTSTFTNLSNAPGSLFDVRSSSIRPLSFSGLIISSSESTTVYFFLSYDVLASDVDVFVVAFQGTFYFYGFEISLEISSFTSCFGISSTFGSSFLSIKSSSISISILS